MKHPMQPRILASVLVVLLLLSMCSIPVLATSAIPAAAPIQLSEIEAPKGYNEQDYLALAGFLETADDNQVKNGVKLYGETYSVENPETWTSAQWLERDGEKRLFMLTISNYSDAAGAAPIGQLDLSCCDTLYSFNCSGSDITSITLPQGRFLAMVEIHYNPKLTRIDLGSQQSLSYISCGDNASLSELVFGDCPNLREVTAMRCAFSSIDVSKLSSLAYLTLDSNRLTAIDLSQNSKLKSVNVSFNQLTELDLSANAKLNELWCTDNKLTELDFSANPKLNTLFCNQNQLTKLDISGLSTLNIFDCSDNQISEITYSAAIYNQLMYFSCSNNPLKSLPTTILSKVRALFCSNIGLETLNISVMANLLQVDCSGNTLTALDLSQNAALSVLNCSNNNIPMLGMDANVNMTVLDVSGNPIRELKVADMNMLAQLNVTNTQITDLQFNEHAFLYLLNTDNTFTEMTAQFDDAANSRELTIPVHAVGHGHFGVSSDPLSTDDGHTVGSHVLHAAAEEGYVFSGWYADEALTDLVSTDVDLELTTLGYPNAAYWALFEEAPTCEHLRRERRGTVAATCTEPGQTGDLYCLDCGEKLEDSTVIPAAGHQFENGSCTVCGAADPDWVKPACDGGENCPSRQFSDVDVSAWYHEAIDYAVTEKLFVGISKTTFAPEEAMTRAMLVTVLWRYAGEPESAANPFTDVPSGEWYAQAVAWAAENGVVNGIGDGKFDPNGLVTREQTAAILFRYAQKVGAASEERAELSGFPDENAVSDYAREAMRWTVAEGIIGGSRESDGRDWLNPQGHATRAQVAAILMRYIENVTK